MKPDSKPPPSRRRALASIAVATLGPILPGCELPVPGQGPPPILYRLTPKSTFDQELPKVVWQLELEVPFANAGLATTRIALLPNRTELEYYARASWTDRAPNMVQSLMVESFENSGRIVGVGRESVPLRADYLLMTDLREFQAEYFHGGLPKIHVSINAKLVRARDRTIIGSKNFSAKVDAEADRLDAIIGAFDEAAGKVFKRLVEWTLVTGETDFQRMRQAAS